MTAPAPAGPATPGAPPRPGDEAKAARRLEAAGQLMARLEVLGLRVSGPWEQTETLTAVSAQCVDVEPYAGRTVWLGPSPGGPSGCGSPGRAFLYWHWQRPLRNRQGLTVGRWFQPFCSAGDLERAAAAVNEVILDDIRRRQGR
ncbi:hypothetical protein [Actinomadura napierensis]|uniref:Uncharacterized protein n=1 Tax=Actinomadura napierensis TaxID=267854 RepID=A0ABN2ZWF0_9ACTN